MIDQGNKDTERICYILRFCSLPYLTYHKLYRKHKAIDFSLTLQSRKLELYVVINLDIYVYAEPGFLAADDTTTVEVDDDTAGSVLYMIATVYQLKHVAMYASVHMTDQL